MPTSPLGVPWYTLLTMTAMFIIAMGAMLGLCWLVVCTLRTLFFSSWIAVNTLLVKVCGWKLTSFGTAHWATKREMRRAHVLRHEGIPLGIWRGETLREPVGGHVALVGPPRSRKSWGLIMPALRQYPGSAVVSDLRGELHQHTANDREALGPVFCFRPGHATSCNINIWDNARWNTEDEYGDVHRIVHHLLHADVVDSGQAFRSSAVPLLTALAIHAHLEGFGHFPGMMEWATNPDLSMSAKLDQLLHSPHPLVQSGARRILDQSERLRASTWNAALDPLSIFQDPTIARCTTKSDVLLTDTLYASRPVSLYLAFSFGDIARLGTFLGVLVNTLIALLGTPRETPRHKVLLCLDEIANLGRLPDLERGVSYLQGSGSQLLLAFQNLQQVQSVYGKDSPLLHSIGTRIYYTPIDTLTASAIAGELGDTTITTQSTAIGTSTSGTSSTQTTREHGRNLLTPDEVRRMAKDNTIVLVEGTAPIFANKLDTPFPQSPLARAAQWLVWHPKLVGSAVGCLMFAMALRPLWTAETGYRAVPSSTPTSAPLTSTTTPSESNLSLSLDTSPKWYLSESRPSLIGDENLTHVKRHYPTHDACRTALQTEYEASIAAAQRLQGLQGMKLEVQRSPDKLSWTMTYPQGQPRVHAAWCEAKAE